MRSSTTFELISAKMEANAEVKKYEDTIKRLFQLLKRVCQERDEAKEQLQLLSTKYQPSIIPSVTNASHEIQKIRPRKPVVLHKATPLMTSRSSTTIESDMMSSKMTSSCLSNDVSLASHEGQSCNLALTKKPDHEERGEKTKENIGCSTDIMVNSASSVIDNLALGKPLPEKGRLLRSVAEAGPLLQTLLVAPPPQWKNPPPSSGDYAIPTSLSSMFPAGNSIGASQMSFGSVNRMHNQIIIGKKRKHL